MVDDAIAKWSGDDFADHWVTDDEGDAAARFVAALDNAVAETDEIFHVVKFEAVFVDGFAFAFAGTIVGVPKFAKEKILETGMAKSGEVGIVSKITSVLLGNGVERFGGGH